MRLTCPTCETAYEVAAGQIPDDGRHVQCSSCHTRWFARPPVEPEPDEDQIIYRLETRSTRRAAPEAAGAAPGLAAADPAPAPVSAVEPPPEQQEGDFLWETASPAGTAPLDPLRRSVRDQPPLPKSAPIPAPATPPAPPRPAPQAAPADDVARESSPAAPPPPAEATREPAVEMPAPPPQAHAEVMREPPIAMPSPVPEVIPPAPETAPVKAAHEAPVEVPAPASRKAPDPPETILREPPREVMRPAPLDLRRAELAPPPPRPAEVPLRALPPAAEAMAATAADRPAGHHLRLDVTDAQVEAWESEERLAPRSRFGRGMFVALVLFVAALGLYLFGGALAAMTPALAPAIEAYVGAVDRLREAMLPGNGASFWPALSEDFN